MLMGRHSSCNSVLVIAALAGHDTDVMVAAIMAAVMVVRFVT